MERRKFIYGALGGLALGYVGLRTSGLKLTSSDAQLVRFSRSAHALGTDVRLTVFHRNAAVAERAVASAFDAIEQVESLMSLYRADSQLSQLNATGLLENPHPQLVEVLEAAMQLSQQSNSAFDVTVQPLWQVHAQASETGVQPTEAIIQEARSKIDWRQVEISADGIRLGREGMQITLNGIAQGFAADAATRALTVHGIESALIDAGEVGSVGRHGQRGDAWSVGVKHPRQPGDLLALAQLEGRCLATSGDYETHFSADFERHHLFDPRTGYSANELAGVSVAAPTAFQADALSTAVFVLGPDAGRELLESIPGADGLFVSKSGHVSRTSGFPLISI